jgi:hypothetical protein
VNIIQKRIKELEGGAFQKLFDAYLVKKYKFANFQTLGVQAGTNKSTKGTPDSYVYTDDGKYILINYGSVSISSQAFKKIKQDVLSCFNKARIELDPSRIEKIICGHCSTDITIEQDEEIRNLVPGVEIEPIGIATLSHDLAYKYPHIANDHLRVPIDTYQFFNIDEFIEKHNKEIIKAPITKNFLYRNKELDLICQNINANRVTVLTGPSGIGKTRLAIEVCRNQKQSTKVLCVLSNGGPLHEDLSYYIDDPGEYLILFDDANMVGSFNRVLKLLCDYPNEYKIKLLITVRDYAKNDIIKLLSKYSTFSPIEIGPFSDNEIEDILKKELDIQNFYYLERINEIANGNIRLAYLAGINAVKGRYPAIRSAEDIFKNYYNTIIEDEIKLNKSEIIWLFLITVAGPVYKDSNQLYTKLKDQFCANVDEKDILERLYQLEVVDWIENKVIKISDQSFGNYITYYVLFTKKWVDIKSFIQIALPLCRDKAIYTLQTLTNIFYSKDLSDYVKESIIFVWDNASPEHEMEYLESFYKVDPDRALYIIQNHIEKISNKESYYTIDVITKYIGILGGFKYTTNYGDSIDLIMELYTKRPDLKDLIVSMIKNKLLYDQMSLTNKYNKEAILIDRLWQLTQNGTNYSNSILYLEIVGKALSVSDIEIYGSSKDENIYRYVKIFLVLTDELKNLRSNMWKSLGILLQQNKYTQYIYQIIIKTLSTYNELPQDELKAFLLSDLESIFSYVINSNEPNFDDAMIVYKYNNIASNNGIIIDPCYHIENAAFKFYKLLNFKPLPQKNYAESVKLFKDMIEEEIKSYKLNDFKELFYKIRDIPEQKRCNLNHGGNVIFELLEKDHDLYQQVLTEYLEAGAPLDLKGNRPINYLLDHIGYKKTYDLINSIKFESKDDWLLLIWKSVKDNDINEKIVSDFHRFIENYLKKNNNNFSPSINMLNKYCKNYSNYTKEIIQAIINNQVISYNFIQSVYVEDKIDDCLRFFNNNLDLLGEIYINAKRIDKWIDYNGKLFTGIFQASPLIWNNYVMWLNDDINNYRYDQLTSEQPIFDLIWQTQEWNKHIDYAFTVMIDTNIVIEQQAKLLFNQSNNDSIMNKKKHWLLDSLHKRINNVDYCKKIIEVVVYAMPDFKKEFILEFLNENKIIEDFKKINLFPMSYISTGIESKISIIQDKITFLQELKECLNTMNNCIPHKYYLSNEILALEKYKKELELNKYIENH